MKCVALLCLLVGFSDLGCSSGQSEQPVVQVKNKEAARGGMGEATNRLPRGEQPPAEVGNGIRGKAMCETELQPGQAGEGQVALRLHKTGSINGTLSFSNRSFSLNGIKDGDTLRLWASAKGDDAVGVHRGFLFGRAQNGGYGGIFAISGNGGEPRVGGTWSAVAD